MLYHKEASGMYGTTHDHVISSLKPFLLINVFTVLMDAVILIMSVLIWHQ